jgi:hypothetical protein
VVHPLDIEIPTSLSVQKKKKTVFTRRNADYATRNNFSFNIIALNSLEIARLVQ